MKGDLKMKKFLSILLAVMMLTTVFATVSFATDEFGANSCIKITSDAAFQLSFKSKGWNGTMEYSTGDGWTTIPNILTKPNAALVGGKYVVYLRGTGNTVVTGAAGSNNGIRLKGTGTFDISGNIMTLLDYATAATNKTVGNNAFTGLFAYLSTDTNNNNNNIVSAPTLPATTIGDSAYKEMFSKCSSLKSAPSLAFESVGSYACESMFNGCTALEGVPSFTFTSISVGCFKLMFNGCSNLICVSEDPGAGSATFVTPNVETKTNWSLSMFANTSTETTVVTPALNTTYYVNAAGSATHTECVEFEEDADDVANRLVEFTFDDSSVLVTQDTISEMISDYGTLEGIISFGIDLTDIPSSLNIISARLISDN